MERGRQKADLPGPRTLHIESTHLLPFKARLSISQSIPSYSINDEDVLALAGFFPPSLQHLTLNSSPSVYSDASELFARAMPMAYIPDLRTVDLSFRHSFKWDAKRVNALVGCLEELRATLAGRGVKVAWDCRCGPLVPFGCYEDLMDE